MVSCVIKFISLKLILIFQNLFFTPWHHYNYSCKFTKLVGLVWSKIEKKKKEMKPKQNKTNH